MKKIKVMSIFGTRPEAIKMAPLVKELEKREEIESIVCVTAQHREMLDQVLEVFDIKPNYDLNIMKKGQTLSEITSRVLLGLEEVIQKEKPNIILVHGDTTTTFAGALAAFYNQVDIGHVGVEKWYLKNLLQLLILVLILLRLLVIVEMHMNHTIHVLIGMVIDIRLIE